MNRFFRTAYAMTLAYLFATILAVLITGVKVPFAAFSCLYFGLLIALLPAASQKLSGKEPLFGCIGAAVALLGFLPIVLRHCPLLHYFVHAIGIACAAVFCSVLRHRTTHDDFEAKYKFTIITVLIMIGFIYLGLLSGIYESGMVTASRENMRLAMNCIVPIAIVLLVTGVLLLRGLRAQDGTIDERTFNLRQLRDTLIFAALVTLIFAVDPFPFLKKAAVFLFKDVLRPAASFLARMLAALLQMMSCARPEAERAPETPAPTADPEAPPVAQLAETQPEHYKIDGKDLSLTISYIFLAAAAVVLLVILALQIKKLVKRLRDRSKNRGRGYPHEKRETISVKNEAHSRGKQPKKRGGTPRERMRYLYAEFLHYLRRVPIRFADTNTCREIEARAKSGLLADSSDLSDFSGLYEQARYREEDVPTEDDERRMKTLLGRIKKG